jgi:hypothetical protein
MKYKHLVGLIFLFVYLYLLYIRIYTEFESNSAIDFFSGVGLVVLSIIGIIVIGIFLNSKWDDDIRPRR